MFVKITLFAYLIDKYFGEFRSIKHPVVFIGDFISFFEKRFYKDDKTRGFLLLVSTLGVFLPIALMIEVFFKFFGDVFYIFALSLISSTLIAHKMLYDSVKEVIISNDPKSKIAMLVSRDTKNLTKSQINKAAIETYAENLSDGVISPLFYLMLFGLKGIVVFKVVNTLDSMVGYKNTKYKNFGFFSAKADDLLNLIPSRFSAFLILLLAGKLHLLKKCIRFAKGHESPNAGYPISAMALCLDISLGGDTSYFGKIKKKPFFGEGKKEITKNDVKKALEFRYRFDILIITVLFISWLAEITKFYQLTLHTISYP